MNQISQAVTTGVVRALEENALKGKKRTMYNRSSSSAAGRATDPNKVSFKTKVVQYYEQSLCMITGRPGAEGAHIIPAAAKYDEYADLTFNYLSEFRIDCARNGLLLCSELENAFDRGAVYFVMNPLTNNIHLYSTNKEFEQYDGMILVYLNKKALPYRRALKDRYNDLVNVANEHGYSFEPANNKTPFTTAIELSDKASENGNNDEDNVGDTESKLNDVHHFNLNAVWICDGRGSCGRKNQDFESSCGKCGTQRTIIDMGTINHQQQEWVEKAQAVYGSDCSKYWRVLGNWAKPKYEKKTNHTSSKPSSVVSKSSK